MKRKVTKKNVLDCFKEGFKDFIEANREDTIMLNEEWSSYVDGLVKNNVVTQWQWENWSNPF